MTDNTKMRDDAIREAARNHAMDEYFKARPQLMRTPNEECLFEAGFDRAWQAAQSVPVVGEPASIPVMQAVTPELASLAYQRAFNGNDSVDFSIRIARHVAVLLLGVESITAQELASLRARLEQAEKERDELRKDAERYRWLVSQQYFRPSSPHMDGTFVWCPAGRPIGRGADCNAAIDEKINGSEDRGD